MSIYESRGVSSDKRLVLDALAGTSRSIFPGAFTQAIPDILTNSPDHCVVMHADGAGTKSSLAYLWWRETGDESVFRGIAEDSMVMNLDDMLCVGATGPFALTNLIGRNARLVPESVVGEIARGYLDLAARLAPFGIDIVSCGGETADVGDLVRTVVVDSVLVSRMRRDHFINIDGVSPGLAIVGLASFGQALWESTSNSGIGANGFTAARHELLQERYRETYPESFDPSIHTTAYAGRFELKSTLPGSDDMSIGQALLSPTRTYAPIVKSLLDVARDGIRGFVHNTGGGLLKCLNFGRNIRYVKDTLLQPPPIFDLLMRESRATKEELVSVFSMGQRMEVYCDPAIADDVCNVARQMRVDAQIIGRTEASESGRELVVEIGDEVVIARR